MFWPIGHIWNVPPVILFQLPYGQGSRNFDTKWLCQCPFIFFIYIVPAPIRDKDHETLIRSDCPFILYFLYYTYFSVYLLQFPKCVDVVFVVFWPIGHICHVPQSYYSSYHMDKEISTWTNCVSVPLSFPSLYVTYVSENLLQSPRLVDVILVVFWPIGHIWHVPPVILFQVPYGQGNFNMKQLCQCPFIPSLYVIHVLVLL